MSFVITTIRSIYTYFIITAITFSLTCYVFGQIYTYIWLCTSITGGSALKWVSRASLVGCSCCYSSIWAWFWWTSSSCLASRGSTITITANERSTFCRCSWILWARKSTLNTSNSFCYTSLEIIITLSVCCKSFCCIIRASSICASCSSWGFAYSI